MVWLVDWFFFFLIGFTYFYTDLSLLHAFIDIDAPGAPEDQDSWLWLDERLDVRVSPFNICDFCQIVSSK